MTEPTRGECECGHDFGDHYESAPNPHPGCYRLGCGCRAFFVSRAVLLAEADRAVIEAAEAWHTWRFSTNGLNATPTPVRALYESVEARRALLAPPPEKHRWIIETERRQANQGESYVYANPPQPPHVFAAVSSSTNANDPGGPHRHVIVSVEPVTPAKAVE